MVTPPPPKKTPFWGFGTDFLRRKSFFHVSVAVLRIPIFLDPRFYYLFANNYSLSRQKTVAAAIEKNWDSQNCNKNMKKNFFLLKKSVPRPQKRKGNPFFPRPPPKKKPNTMPLFIKQKTLSSIIFFLKNRFRYLKKKGNH